MAESSTCQDCYTFTYLQNMFAILGALSWILLSTASGTPGQKQSNSRCDILVKNSPLQAWQKPTYVNPPIGQHHKLPSTQYLPHQRL